MQKQGAGPAFGHEQEAGPEPGGPPPFRSGRILGVAMLVVVAGMVLTGVISRPSVAPWWIFGGLMILLVLLLTLLFAWANYLAGESGGGGRWARVLGIVGVFLFVPLGGLGFMMAATFAYSGSLEETRAYDASPEGREVAANGSARNALLGFEFVGSEDAQATSLADAVSNESPIVVAAKDTVDAGTFTLNMLDRKIAPLDGAATGGVIKRPQNFSTVTYTVKFTTTTPGADPGLALNVAYVRVLGGDGRLYSGEGCTYPKLSPRAPNTADGTVTWCRIVPVAAAENASLEIHFRSLKAGGKDLPRVPGPEREVLWGDSAQGLLDQARAAGSK